MESRDRSGRKAGCNQNAEGLVPGRMQRLHSVHCGPFADNRLSHRKLSLAEGGCNGRGRVWGKKAGTVVKSYCHSEGDRGGGPLWVEAVRLEKERWMQEVTASPEKQLGLQS